MEPFIAEIKLFGGNFAPRGWAFCEGQTLPISGHEALFSLLGVQYGGDGRTNFQLPNLAPLTEQDGNPTPIRYIIALEGVYPSRP
ncbi:phage tail protein [Haliangium ochraceum]|uniref:Tail Collar domain protein n=1 Tax=Haliangium ochraceum (strain DSM 14365 / JCM 11303 / SMP-2) TaxID=502025 RepID=D0LGU7_HALO1|nr:tail fiber protein [Haliangium ochraceum]ACY14669.1 Tail Collar domain protein [Haliangium ochraceum DSM 14365]